MYQENFMIREAMQEIARNYGVMAFSDANSLMKYYADMAPERHREQMVLDAFLRREGNLQFYNAARKSREEQTAMYENLVHSICIETALDERLVREVAGAVAQVLWDYDPGSPQGSKLSLFVKLFRQNRTVQTWQNKTKPSRDPGKGLMKNNSLVKRERQENTQSESPKPVRKKNGIFWAGLAMIVVALAVSMFGEQSGEKPIPFAEVCTTKNWYLLSIEPGNQDGLTEAFTTADPQEMQSIVDALDQLRLIPVEDETEENFSPWTRKEDVPMMELDLFDESMDSSDSFFVSSVYIYEDGTVFLEEDNNGTSNSGLYRTEADLYRQLVDYHAQYAIATMTFREVEVGETVLLSEIMPRRELAYLQMRAEDTRHVWDAEQIALVEEQFAQTSLCRIDSEVSGLSSVLVYAWSGRNNSDEDCYVIELYDGDIVKLTDGERSTSYTGGGELRTFLLDMIAEDPFVAPPPPSGNQMLKDILTYSAEEVDSVSIDYRMRIPGFSLPHYGVQDGDAVALMKKLETVRIEPAERVAFPDDYISIYYYPIGDGSGSHVTPL